jgi:hypothetical protein
MNPSTAVPLTVAVWVAAEVSAPTCPLLERSRFEALQEAIRRETDKMAIGKRRRKKGDFLEVFWK